MAKAVRRCFKKAADGKWTVGKMCNRVGSSQGKYATGKSGGAQKPNLNLSAASRKRLGMRPKNKGRNRGRVVKADGTPDKRYKRK